MADPLALICAIDALIELVQSDRHRQKILDQEGIVRLTELDEIIGSECQQLGIAIQHLDQRHGQFTGLFGFTRLPCTPFVGGGTMPEPSRNWMQTVRVVRRIASEMVAANTAQIAQEQAVSANRSKLFPKGIPETSDIVDLVLRLDTERDSGKSMNRIAREFTGETLGHDKRAKSLLSQIRRLKREGRVII